jgi:hypothetical protein
VVFSVIIAAVAAIAVNARRIIHPPNEGTNWPDIQTGHPAEKLYCYAA